LLGTLAAGAVVSVVGALHVSAATDVSGGRMRDSSIPQWSRYVEQETRERVAAALTAGLDDEKDQVRQAATDALSVVRHQAEGRILVTGPCRGNCVSADDTVGTFLWNLWAMRGLSSPDAETRQQALMKGGVFLRGTRTGTLALAEALMDTDPGVRTWAAIRLDSVQSAEMVSSWIWLLNDADGSLRERATISLGVIGDALAVDPLTSTLLNDESPIVRRGAARALGYIAAGSGE
jgi:HEAT repeat protein